MKLRIVYPVVVSLLIAGCGMPAPRRYSCVRSESPIRIDGRLDEAAWQKAAWTEPFADISGPGHPRPRHATRAKLLWDDRFLYIGAQLEEPHVWATLRQRDDIVFRDPDFEVFIDPDGDCREYYEVEINAFNTLFDLLLVRTYRDGGPARIDWNMAGLESAVFVDGTINDSRDTDRGWSVELAMPWSSLAEYAHRPCPPRRGDVWRANFSRVEWTLEQAEGGLRKKADTPEDNWVWSPQGVIDMHRPQTWGYIIFSD